MATYELVEHIEVGSGGAASIDFVSVGDIPSDYADIKIVVSARSERVAFAETFIMRFNSSTTGYSYQQLYAFQAGGKGATTGSSFGLVGSAPAVNGTTSTYNSLEIYIPNYRSSSYKSYNTDSVMEQNADTAWQFDLVGGLWSNTDPITSVQILPSSGANWAEGTSATLYGIRKYNTDSTPKATGGAITYDSVNSKWVHTFTASGTFTPSENLTGVEYLVIAGGGGSNTAYNTPRGGGGAGGYRSSVSGESSGGGASAETPLSLTASTGYTVTVGAGGAGAIVTGQGANGSDSTFSTITSTGGGRGGYNDGVAGAAGGSGGGGSYGGAGGAGTSNQGYAGGAGSTGSNQPSGGGGGAGGTGAAGGSSTGGAGGVGVASSITGTSIYRAGGGGGSTYSGGTPGTGGLGGGGNGNRLSKGDDGKPATGGGGGGTGDYSTGSGGSGGSGVVIVRYDA